MPREKISAAQRVQEGRKLSQLIESAKASEPGLTQESLASEMNVTQGLVGQWVAGKTPIPDRRLLWLSVRLRFDPVEFRPGIADLAPNRAASGSQRLSEVIGKIPKGQEDKIADILAPIVEALKGNR